MRQAAGNKLRLRPWVWRVYAVSTLTAYSLLSLGCAACVVIGIWHDLVTVSLIASALGVYCGSELRALVVWVRSADPSGPPVAPAWNVFICALVFVGLVVAARWVWGQ